MTRAEQNVSAIILAAGRGMRLRPHSQSKPKAMITIGSAPLLGWQLAALEAMEVPRCVICVGHAAETVERYVQAAVDENATHMDVRTVVNESYATTGTAYSLRRALHAVQGSDVVVVLEGDVLLEAGFLAQLMGEAAERQSAGALVAASLAAGDSSAVYTAKDGRVTRVIGAARRDDSNDGRDDEVLMQNMSCYLFRGATMLETTAALLDAIVADDPSAPVEVLLDMLAAHDKLYVCNSDPSRAREIDTSEDLAAARQWWTARGYATLVKPVLPSVLAT